MTEEPFKNSSTDTASEMYLPKQLQNTEHQKDMKLSSIDWFNKETWRLRRQLEKKELTLGEYATKHYALYEQANEMHKEEQLNTAYDFYYGKYSIENFEEYYNETFNNPTEIKTEHPAEDLVDNFVQKWRQENNTEEAVYAAYHYDAMVAFAEYYRTYNTEEK